jgi:hypothetical protein
MEVGSIYSTNVCGDIKILKYINCHKVRVKFLTTGRKTYAAANNIRKGKVSDLYYPTVAGTGYLGEGPYAVMEGKKISRIYSLWRNMLIRCYDHADLRLKPYDGVLVDTKWHNFQKFAADIETLRGYDKEGWDLDKDLLNPTSKEYSLRNCCFVPHTINATLLGVGCSSNRSKPVNSRLPAGVVLTKSGNFVARIMIDRKFKHLGTCDTPQEAHALYLIAKAARLKTLAKAFKTDLDPKVYRALVNWKGQSWSKP